MNEKILQYIRTIIKEQGSFYAYNELEYFDYMLIENNFNIEKTCDYFIKYYKAIGYLKAEHVMLLIHANMLKYGYVKLQVSPFIYDNTYLYK